MAHAQLTTLHLARLSQLYPRPLAELGPNVTEVPDEYAAIVDEQLTAAGLLSGELTSQAHALLDPLFGYENAFTAVILLHNQRQMVTFDLDEKWVEYMQKSPLSNTPRVYVLVASKGTEVATAVRAGDHVDVSVATTSESLPLVAARELLRVGDPDGRWSPATIPAVTFPAELLDRAPARAPLPGSADTKAHEDHKLTVRRFADALRKAEVPSRSIMAVEKFLELDHVAATHISYVSGAQRLLSEGTTTIDYFHEAGISVGGVQKTGDGRLWKTLAPATEKGVQTSLTFLTRLPARPMLEALSGF